MTLIRCVAASHHMALSFTLNSFPKNGSSPSPFVHALIQTQNYAIEIGGAPGPKLI